MKERRDKEREIFENVPSERQVKGSGTLGMHPIWEYDKRILEYPKETHVDTNSTPIPKTDPGTLIMNC